jgi:26S proteasome regulatory subunit N2
VTEAMHLLQPYLPPNPNGDEDGDGGGNPVSPSGGYAEGGSLYALGLIHGSQTGTSREKRDETTAFLRNHLRASHANEVISHGAALGVGLTALGSANLTIVNELKEILTTRCLLLTRKNSWKL